MNTPAHLLFGGAAFSKKANATVTAAAFFGGFFPDLSLYLLAGVSLFVLDISPHRVFDELYFSDAWQQVFAIDNSFVLFGLLIAWAFWAKKAGWIAFAGAALLHIAVDFPLHGEDARMNFWPISDWVFRSPVSYWDTRAGAGLVGPVEIILSVAAAVLLLRRHIDWRVRVFVVFLLGLEFMASGIWSFIF